MSEEKPSNTAAEIIAEMKRLQAASEEAMARVREIQDRINTLTAKLQLRVEEAGRLKDQS